MGCRRGRSPLCFHLLDWAASAGAWWLFSVGVKGGGICGDGLLLLVIMGLLLIVVVVVMVIVGVLLLLVVVHVAQHLWHYRRWW